MTTTRSYQAERRLAYAPPGGRFPEAYGEASGMKTHEDAGDGVPLCGTPLPDNQYTELAAFRLGPGPVTCLRCARTQRA